MSKNNIDLPFRMGISPTLKIRGLIATQDIKKNTIIERCPIILVEVKYEDFLEKTKFSSYYFVWDKEYDCIVLGYGEILNHSRNNNVSYLRDKKNMIMIYKTTKDIKAGEELTIDYTGGTEEETYPEHTDFHKKIGKTGL